MDTSQASVTPELPVRISARAVIAGILVGLAMAAMLAALGAALGTTVFPGGAVGIGRGLGLGAWFLTSFAASSFAGGWIAAASARALRHRDGVLHGVVTWAAMALATTTMVGGVMHAVAAAGLGQRSLIEAGAWGSFAVLAVSLASAIGGGLVGVERERIVVGLAPARPWPRRRALAASSTTAAPVEVRLGPPVQET